MILNQREAIEQTVLEGARQIMAAARTAPKGKGVDVVEIATVWGDDLQTLADTMRQISAENGQKFFLRDAENVFQADAIILIGTREHPQGLNCLRCGYEQCDLRPKDVPCEINAIDVGIALGSAAAKAADLRFDTRIMHSAGMAAMRLGWPDKETKDTFALLLSVKSKNPFFDRKPKQEAKEQVE